MRRFGFVGSRTWTDELLIARYVHALRPDDVVVSGGARGADEIAERIARERGLYVVVHRADWNTHGKRAGFIRNSTIVDDVHGLYAFWDGTSNGTHDTITKARIANKPVVIVYPDGHIE